MNDLIKEFEIAKEIFNKKYTFIDNFDDAPKSVEDRYLKSIDLTPAKLFLLLSYLIGEKYIDIYKKKGFNFIDNKINWEFNFQLKDSVKIKVYDWKGYSVKVASFFESEQVRVEEGDRFSDYISSLMNKFDEFQEQRTRLTLEKEPISNFLSALYSLEILNARAKEEGFLLEQLVSSVAILDTLLRYAILLTRINNNLSKYIVEEWAPLYSQVSKSYISERAIFNIAEKELNFGNLNKEVFFQQLNSFYDERNKAVHRYSITSYRYQDINRLIVDYDKFREILYGIVKKLEKEQADLEVGFIKKEDLEKPNEDEVRELVLRALELKVDLKYSEHREAKRDSMFDYKD